MPRHTYVQLAANQWTELTDGDVITPVFLQNTSNFVVSIAATTGAAAPGDTDPVWQLAPYATSNLSPAELSPGLSGAIRLWARCKSGPIQMPVSHQ